MVKSLRDKVALVTGVSSGLGRALAQVLLAEGAVVAGTVRQAEQISEFEALAPGRALGLKMDITDVQAVAAGVQQAIDRLHQIDILANNAGFGVVGAVEETSDAEIQQIFDVNVFGGLRVTRALLPHMRQRRSGHILNFSAIGGFIGYPGLGIYSAAKAATAIAGEALASEVKPLGIDVTNLTIGVFHTEFAGRSLHYTAQQIDDYAETPAGQFRDIIASLQGKQPNDPAKGAAAIVALLKADTPPLHAALGADALAGMRSKLKSLDVELATWEANATSTGRPSPE